MFLELYVHKRPGRVRPPLPNVLGPMSLQGLFLSNRLARIIYQIGQEVA